MPFGLGAIAGFFVRKRKYKKELGQKDEHIVFFERECSKPVVSELSGTELVDGTITLLDATLERYILEKKGKEKLQCIKLYLEKIEEVYWMNKDSLENIPATRKEMLALGLALRHVTVALDQEFAGLNALKAQINQELHNVRSASAENAKAIGAVKSQVEQEISRFRSHYAQQLEGLERSHKKTRLLTYVGIGIGVLLLVFYLLQLFNLVG